MLLGLLLSLSWCHLWGLKHFCEISGVVSPPRCPRAEIQRAQVEQATYRECGCGFDLVGSSCLLGLCELPPCPERAGFSWHLLSMPVGGSELQTSTVPNLEVNDR